jgi:hypothetical protein
MESNGSELALLPLLLLESGPAGGAAGLGTDQEPHLEPQNSSRRNEGQKGWEGRYTADLVPGSEQLTNDEFNVSNLLRLMNRIIAYTFLKLSEKYPDV